MHTHQKIHYCLPRVLCIQKPKLLFLQHLAIAGFPQSDDTVSKLSVDADFTVKHSEIGLHASSHPQNSASHLLGLQGPQQTSNSLLSSPFCSLLLNPLYKLMYLHCPFCVMFCHSGQRVKQ